MTENAEVLLARFKREYQEKKDALQTIEKIALEQTNYIKILQQEYHLLQKNKCKITSSELKRLLHLNNIDFKRTENALQSAVIGIKKFNLEVLSLKENIDTLNENIKTFNQVKYIVNRLQRIEIENEGLQVENKVFKNSIKLQQMGIDRTAQLETCMVCYEQNTRPTILLHANNTSHMVCFDCAVKLGELCPACRLTIIGMSNLF